MGFSSRLGAFFALLQPLYISQATAEFKVFGALMAVDERTQAGNICSPMYQIDPPRPPYVT
ncbi:MAG: hypothetical protein DMG11_24295 [Acidobacteria bacterium]|nr:MAG: hypothetical protein DMG11_24295 [Acidobacteriota bacterium]